MVVVNPEAPKTDSSLSASCMQIAPEFGGSELAKRSADVNATMASGVIDGAQFQCTFYSLLCTVCNIQILEENYKEHPKLKVIMCKVS